MLQSVAISAGTGKSHVLVALGIAAVEAGHKVRYFTAADLAEILYRAARSQTTASSPRRTFSPAEPTGGLGDNPLYHSLRSSGFGLFFLFLKNAGPC